MSGGILPGMGGPEIGRHNPKHRMQSNIFGVDEATKIEYGRTSIGHDIVSNGNIKNKSQEKVEEKSNGTAVDSFLGSIPIYFGKQKTQRFSLSFTESFNLKYKKGQESVNEKYEGCFMTNSVCPLLESVSVSTSEELFDKLREMDNEFIQHGVTKMIIPVRMSNLDEYIFKFLQNCEEKKFFCDVVVLPVIDCFPDRASALARISSLRKNNLVQINQRISEEKLPELISFLRQNKILAFMSVKDCRNESEELEYLTQISQQILEKEAPIVVTGLKYAKSLGIIDKLHNSQLSLPIYAFLSMDFENETMDQHRDNFYSLVESGTILGLKHIAGRCMVQWAKKCMNQFSYTLPTMIKLLGVNVSSYLGLINDVLSEGIIWDYQHNCNTTIKDGKVIFSQENGRKEENMGSSIVNTTFEMDSFNILEKKKSRYPDLVNKFSQELTKGSQNTQEVQPETNEIVKDEGPVPTQDQLNSRRGTRRTMHESSFSLSGAQVDDHMPQRTSIRTKLPPGGGTDTRLW